MRARYLLMRFNVSERVRGIGGLTTRLIMILAAMALLLIPLTQSLGRLSDRFAVRDSLVSYERVPSTYNLIGFGRNQPVLTPKAWELLDQVAQALKRYPELAAEIKAKAERVEREQIAEARARAIGDYLREQGGATPERIKTEAVVEASRDAVIRLAKVDQVK
ncbi:MAG TPA: OmpA family protein [Blastocatellia bacterium]|nr:OmpA family protein [Blastocatellia bacterium]